MLRPAAAVILASLVALPHARPAIAGMIVEPVCGDVNDSTTITTSDALLVLRKSVGQGVTLDCSGFQDQISACNGQLGICQDDATACAGAVATCTDEKSACQADLAACQAITYCGDGVVNGDEQCDTSDLASQTCESLGYTGGTLECTAACAYITSGCESPRFETTPLGTVIDHETGLEWELKDNADGNPDPANPHDADNTYTFSSGFDVNLPDGTVFTHFLGTLNEGYSDDGKYTLGCFAGYCDWRLPTYDEATTIQVQGCGSPPCVVDPVFLPAAIGTYNTSSRVPHDPLGIYAIDTEFGFGGNFIRAVPRYARAVRRGSPGALLTCPGSGLSYRGHCWYLGALEDSCSSVCDSRGGVYDGWGTADIAGSSGDPSICEALLDLLGAPGSGLQFPSLDFSAGVGCGYDLGSQRARVVNPETSAEAVAAGIGRVCACSAP